MPITQACELVTTASASQVLGIVPDTLRTWRRLGRITPAFVTPTGVCLYRRDELEQIAEARRLEAERKQAAHAEGEVA